MSKNNKSRRNIHQKRRKPKKRKRGCLIFFIVIIVLLLVIGGIAAYFYNNVTSTVDVIQQSRPEEQVNLRDELESDVSRIQNNEPFSILILGVEPETEGSIEEGQSDIMIVATVNPEKESMVMTNIPSNLLTEISGQDSENKISKAYELGGISTAVNTTQELLQVPIDYTLTVNLNGISDIINALGEVTVTSTATFDQNGYSFVEGQTYTMDGEMALAYIGDIDEAIQSTQRQDRARQVVSSIVPQLSQINSITSIPKLLGSLNGNVLTNLSFKDIQTIAMDYRHIITDVEAIQLKGNAEEIDGVNYEVLDSDTLSTLQDQLQAELEQ